MTEQDAPQPPSVQITRGNATEEELAALFAVVSDAYLREQADAVAEEPKVSAWRQAARGLRRPLQHGTRWGRFTG